MSQASITGSRDLGDILTIAFGTAVTMWTVAYLCGLPGSPVPSWLLVVLMLALLLAGGFVAGRWTDRRWTGGAFSGLVTGLLNLLVLGGLLSEAQPGELVALAIAWMPGSVIVAVAFGGLGATLGSRARQTAVPTSHWPARFASVATAATVVLLSVGGVVTGYKAGLAVPDWPTSYGYNMFLYPLARMTGGVYYEHAHRLFGSLVGLTTLVLAVYLQFVDRRVWLRCLALIALVLVVVQGVLGGFRVTGGLSSSASPDDLSPNLGLAVVHGVTAQVFFAVLVGLRVFLSPTWRAEAPPVFVGRSGTDRVLGQLGVGLLLLQIVLGALLRHVEWGLHLHVALAVLVLLLTGTFAVRAWGLYEQLPAIHQLGRFLMPLTGAQLVLGLGALIATGGASPSASPGTARVLVTTAHQTIGAVLLACTLALLLWHYRLVRSPRHAERPRPATRTERIHEPTVSAGD